MGRGAGRPATVPGTEHEGRPGVLRITLARQGNRELAEIDWDAWFAPFNQRQLVFIYQETTSDGDQSNFFRLDSPEREDAQRRPDPRSIDAIAAITDDTGRC
jgi:hypothetical protein